MERNAKSGVATSATDRRASNATASGSESDITVSRVLRTINKATQWWVTAAAITVLLALRTDGVAWALSGSVAAAVFNKSELLISS